MDRFVRLGVIGIGNMGSEHCRNLMAGKCPEIRLAAVADLREERRAWAGRELPESVRVYASGRELIASGTCDAVLIAAPHFQHEPLAVEALDHGLHVMCEKPIAVSVSAAERMLAAASRSGKTLALMFNQRTNCVYRTLKQALEENRLGKIKRMIWTVTDWYRSQAYYDSGSWRATWKGEGGGVLLNQCPHQLDLLVWLFGLPAKVLARAWEGKWHRIEVEDDVTAFMEFPSGATGVLIASTGDLPGSNRLEIIGEYGKIICEEDTLRFYQLERSEREICFSDPNPWPQPRITVHTLETDGRNEQHPGVLNAFAAHLLRGEPLIASAEDGVRSLMLSNAIHFSAWTGKEISLPPDQAAFDRLLEERISGSELKKTADRTYHTSHLRTGSCK